MPAASPSIRRSGGWRCGAPSPVGPPRRMPPWRRRGLASRRARAIRSCRSSWPSRLTNRTGKGSPSSAVAARRKWPIEARTMLSTSSASSGSPKGHSRRDHSIAVPFHPARGVGKPSLIGRPADGLRRVRTAPHESSRDLERQCSHHCVSSAAPVAHLVEEHAAFSLNRLPGSAAASRTMASPARRAPPRAAAARPRIAGLRAGSPSAGRRCASRRAA